MEASLHRAVALLPVMCSTIPPTEGSIFPASGPGTSFKLTEICCPETLIVLNDFWIISLEKELKLARKL